MTDDKPKSCAAQSVQEAQERRAMTPEQAHDWLFQSGECAQPITHADPNPVRRDGFLSKRECRYCVAGILHDLAAAAEARGRAACPKLHNDPVAVAEAVNDAEERGREEGKALGIAVGRAACEAGHAMVDMTYRPDEGHFHGRGLRCLACEKDGAEVCAATHAALVAEAAQQRQQQILAFAEAVGVRDAEYTVAGFGVSRLLKALSDPEFQWVTPSAAPPQPTPAEEDGNVE